jgi:Uma2 family endonuclease
MSISVKPLPGTVFDPLYPETDGKPMGETGAHVRAILRLYENLHVFFQDVPNVYIAADMFWYYERGNPRACKAPDVMVIKGVGRHERLSFRAWEENAHPCAIFEVTSKKTRKKDLGDKKDTYAQLGVMEYFIFDPLGEYLDPPLQGFRLENGVYQPLTPAEDGSLISQELGLRLVPEGEKLRLVDAATGRPVLTERERAAQAEQLAEQAKQLADEEKQRADEEKQRADEEKQRADALAAELARLRASLPKPEDGPH